MIFRSIILLLCITIHGVTPSWFLSNFLSVSDWLMVLFCITSLGIFYFYRDKKFLSILTSILSINALICYLATIKGSTFESLYEDSFCRITVILNYSCIIST